MSDSFIIAPSILSADFANLKSEIDNLIALGENWIHVDVMDGHFVPNLTIGAPVVRSLRKIDKAFLDCHLMISQPQKYIDDFIKAGADLITLHIESEGDHYQMIRHIRNAGKKVGLTLRPATSLETIEPYLQDLDLVLVMTVNPGFGGQSFMSDQVQKVQQLKQWRDERGLKFWIQVDGGVSDITKKQLNDADVLVAGSYVFNHPEGVATAIKKLKEKQ